MKNTLLALALISTLGLTACERPTLVAVPVAPIVVPGPPGPAGATGATGEEPFVEEVEAVLGVEHALEVANAAGEVLHFAETLLHRLESIADELERLTEPLLEGVVQFLVDGATHFVEFAFISFLQLAHALIECAPHAVERGLRGIDRLGDLFAQLTRRHARFLACRPAASWVARLMRLVMPSGLSQAVSVFL